jgi:hypothetical protein
LAEWLRINDKDANRWQEIKPADCKDAELEVLAREVVVCLLNGFKSTCMVIMPFDEDHDPLYDEVIVPALEKADFRPIRTDRLNMTGNIVDTIHQAILNCDCAVAVLNNQKPNVMYELGLAHAHQKPVVMLAEGSTPKLPFDIVNHAVITYPEIADPTITKEFKAQINGKLRNQITSTLTEIRKRFVPNQ